MLDVIIVFINSLLHYPLSLVIRCSIPTTNTRPIDVIAPNRYISETCPRGWDARKNFTSRTMPSSAPLSTDITPAGFLPRCSPLRQQRRPEPPQRPPRRSSQPLAWLPPLACFCDPQDHPQLLSVKMAAAVCDQYHNPLLTPVFSVPPQACDMSHLLRTIHHHHHPRLWR